MKERTLFLSERMLRVIGMKIIFSIVDDYGYYAVV